MARPMAKDSSSNNGVLLDDIDSPADIKKLSIAQLKQLAEEIRQAITETIAPAGFAKDDDVDRLETVSEANLDAVVGTVLGTPDGTLKRSGPGTVLLAEDMEGTGHSTRVIGNEPRFAIIIPLT